jgi:hypothetical protein
MATRSTIAMIAEDGQMVRSVYCHWDGYPDGVGATLREHYTDPAKIQQLLDLGDISSLREDIGEQHDFDSARDVTTFYGRDRGEIGVYALPHMNIDGWLALRKGNGCEYGYLWNGKHWHTFYI